MIDQPAELVLRGTVRYAMTIGYGHVYDLHVDAVVTGDFTESRVPLTTLAGDETSERFLAGHQAPARVEIRFARGGADQPYRTMPITGFVDRNMTAWEVRELRAAPAGDGS